MIQKECIYIIFTEWSLSEWENDDAKYSQKEYFISLFRPRTKLIGLSLTGSPGLGCSKPKTIQNKLKHATSFTIQDQLLLVMQCLVNTLLQIQSQLTFHPCSHPSRRNG